MVKHCIEKLSLAKEIRPNLVTRLNDGKYAVIENDFETWESLYDSYIGSLYYNLDQHASCLQYLFSPISVIMNLTTQNSHVNNYLATSKNKKRNINLMGRCTNKQKLTLQNHVISLINIFKSKYVLTCQQKKREFYDTICL